MPRSRDTVEGGESKHQKADAYIEPNVTPELTSPTSGSQGFNERKPPSCSWSNNNDSLPLFFFSSPHSNDCNGPSCCFSISLCSLSAPLPIIHNLVRGGLLSHLTACVDCIENIKRLNYKDMSRVNALLLTASFNVLHNYSSSSQLA